MSHPALRYASSCKEVIPINSSGIARIFFPATSLVLNQLMTESTESRAVSATQLHLDDETEARFSSHIPSLFGFI